MTKLEEITSRNYAQHLIEKNLVKVDGKLAKASLSLSIGQVVEIELPELVPSELIPYNFKLDIIFEDEHLLVINKPSGLVVHPSAGHQQDTLVNALLHHTQDLSMKNEQRPGIVHRLDKETSGLLVVAKKDFTHEKLAAQFKDKTSHRIYYALLDGQLPRTAGVCSSFLARHPVDRKRYASLRELNKIINVFDSSITNGKWAVTHFTKMAQHSHMSYVKLRLETGRTHQIRIHMSELGHPLVGDTLYGYSVKKMKELGVQRFYLHAAELGFLHPMTGEAMMFKTPWPEADVKILNSFGFDNATLSK